MERAVLVALAGALGALSRYGVQTAVADMLGRTTVLGTLLVNISGAFVLGLVLAATAERFEVPQEWRTAASVGFLGAYTTFSTLMFDSVSRFEAGDLPVAFANLIASIGLGLIAVYAGLTLGRAL